GFLLHSLDWSNVDGDDDATVACDLTLGDLGGIVGISPETACRVLSDLKAGGVVETRPAGILVRDHDRLRRLART
ncbi:MAG: helix-turn-helix domain-containing protein, partial [Phycisphaerae bacterium]|nr:helix-turn-helix domain-containing protein [Phycisphaerae bacterium]